MSNNQNKESNKNILPNYLRSQSLDFEGSFNSKDDLFYWKNSNLQTSYESSYGTLPRRGVILKKENICAVHKPIYVSSLRVVLKQNSPFDELDDNDIYYSKCHIKPCLQCILNSNIPVNEKQPLSLEKNDIKQMNTTNIWRDANITFEEKLKHLRELNKRNPTCNRFPYLNTTPTLQRKFIFNTNYSKPKRRNSEL